MTNPEESEESTELVEQEHALVEAVACAVKGKSVHDLTETDLEDAEDYVREATPTIQQQEREAVVRALFDLAAKDEGENDWIAKMWLTHVAKETYGIELCPIS